MVNALSACYRDKMGTQPVYSVVLPSASQHFAGAYGGPHLDVYWDICSIITHSPS